MRVRPTGRPTSRPTLRPRGRRSAALGLGGAALALLTACSGSPGAPGSASPSAPASATESAASSPTATPSASASPSVATLPAAECLTGTWELVRFVGAGGETYGTGEGGDVSVRFRGTGYTVSGAGKKPMTITLAGRTAQLRVDGEAQGTYTLSGATATFDQGSASGSGTLTASGQTEKLSMEQVTRVVGLNGDGQVACTAEAMTVTLPTVRLELARS